MSSDPSAGLRNAADTGLSHLPVDVATTSTTTFQYQPLDAEKRQIRLLRIIPDSADQPIRCTLSTFYLETKCLDPLETGDIGKKDAVPSSDDAAPEYLALSYMWGAPIPTFDILVNGRSHNIRENLYHFLVDYRAERQDVYLWIDQICIDQENLQERSAQVRIMGSVYENCSKVIVWLGDDSDDLRAAARRLSMYRISTNRQGVPEAIENALIVLLNNKYFNRLWIVQEVVLAPRVHILVRGKVWVSWNTIINAFIDYWGVARTLRDCSVQPSATALLFQRLSKSQYTILSTWIADFAGNECQDPRDKVYGLLAVMDPSQRLSVDYTKSIIEIFLDMVIMCWNDSYYADSYLFGRAKDRTTLTTLSKLGQYMGLNKFQLSGMEAMLLAVSSRATQSSNVFEKPQVTVVLGYEFAGVRMPSIRDADVDAGAVVDRWWFEVDGESQYHECRLSDPEDGFTLQEWGFPENTISLRTAVKPPKQIFQAEEKAGVVAS